MVGNPDTTFESVHHHAHWQADECADRECRPRDTEGPSGDSPIAPDAVVIVQTLAAPDV